MARSAETKTLAMKLLEGKGVPYQVFTYPAGQLDAEQVAVTLGVPASQLFKTLVVVRRAGKPMLVMVPADRQLDLKLLAKASGEKRLRLATLANAESLTGLRAGGISPLALLNRGFEVWLDQSALAYEAIYLSAGQRGINIRVPVAALQSLTAARVADVGV